MVGALPRLFVLEAMRPVCPECGGARLVRDYERAELVCAGCGFVISNRLMDAGPEWRAYDRKQEEFRSRAGPPPSLMRHDKGLTTDISTLKSRGATPERWAQFRRLRKLQTRARVADGAELRLARMLAEIERLSSQLGLPHNVREAAAFVYRRASKEFDRLPPTANMATAVILIACREKGLPRTLTEMAKAGGLEKRQLMRCYSKLTRKLGICLSPTSCQSYIIRYGTDLGICGDVQRRAVMLAEKMAKKSLHNMSPKAVAAATLYIACRENGLPYTQRELADAVQMTDVTVRNAYKRICASLGIEMPLSGTPP